MRLILSRSEGEEIVIGPPSAPLGLIRIGRYHRGQIRLHFDFPADIAVNRREIAESKAGEPLPPFGRIGNVSAKYEPRL